MGCLPHVRIAFAETACRRGFSERNLMRLIPAAERGSLKKLPALNDGQLDTAFDDARADRVARETGGVVDVELLHEMLAMFLHRLDADSEFRRGFLVGLALGNELEHLHLA